MQKAKRNKNKALEIPKPALIYTQKFRIGGASIVAGLVVLMVTFFYPGISDVSTTRDIGIVFGILIAIVPFTLLQVKEVQRKDSIDKNLPLFLLSLLSTVQSGSNLIRAIEQTADRQMGSLTPELKNLRANISWGMSLDDALDHFADRCGTRLSKRVITLLGMSIKIGGDVTSNLEMIQKHTTDLQNLEKERKSSLAPYIYTIYISFAVFIGIAVIISSQFFAEIGNVQDMLAESDFQSGKADCLVKYRELTLMN